MGNYDRGMEGAIATSLIESELFANHLSQWIELCPGMVPNIKRGVNMKSVTLLILLACASFVCAGQTPSSSTGTSKCTLTRAQAPEIRGIRLGMTPDQISSLFPEDGNRLKISEAVRQSKKAPNYGVARFDLQAERETPNPRFAGVNFITIELLDERVTGFYIGYFGPEWNSVDQFVAKLSETLRLPSASWEQAGDNARLMCDGFAINASAASGSTQSWVRVQDTSAPRVVEDRRKTDKEKARQAFKP